MPAFFLQLYGTLRTIKQQQCRLLQSGADFSLRHLELNLLHFSRETSKHIYLFQMLVLCVYLFVLKLTLQHTVWAPPSPASHHCLKFLQEFYLKFQCIKITRLPPPPPAAPSLCPPLTPRHYRGGSEPPNTKIFGITQYIIATHKNISYREKYFFHH